MDHGSGLARRAFPKGLLGTAAGAALTPALGCREPLVPEDARATAGAWDAGEVVHLLPTASHQRIRLKASFRTPLERAPQLAVGGRTVAGVRGDSRGLFWSFDVAGLPPATRQRLELRDAEGRALCEPRPLRTLPAPSDRPERLRLLVYTCAGGPDNLYDFGVWNAFLPVAQRQRLLRRALAFEPDAVVANGDHVYWDLQSRFGWAMGRSWRARALAEHFDRERAVLGTGNEDVLLRAFGPQLAGLYGVLFRSLPVFFLQDDHDYGENDEASQALRTFPPDAFALDLARSAHLAHMPSTPVLWTAGKWGEWYADAKDESGVLRADVAKPYWPGGWQDQHDRLLAAASERRDRTPLFVSGDLHALAAGRILASREHSFRENPVVSVLVGAVGTGPLGWPSEFRGQHPVASGTLELEETLAPLDENGFSLLDVTPGELRVSQFRWTPEQGDDALDDLQPFAVHHLPRPGVG